MCYVLDENGKVKRVSLPRVSKLPEVDYKAKEQLREVYKDYAVNGVNVSTFSELLKEAGSLENLIYSK